MAVGHIELYCYFIGVAGHNDRARALLCELSCADSFGNFDDTCKQFKTWFRKIKLGGDHFKEFRLLHESRNFRDLCDCLYDGTYRLHLDELQLHLESSDGKILKVDKSVAAAESVVLNGLVDSIGGQGLIAVPGVSGNVLSQILHFCQKKQDFGKVLETLLGHYKGWVTCFLKSNQAILHDLHMAADFLNIPSLLSLTTQAVTDLVGNAFEGISEWCGNLSMSRLLSSLSARVGEDVPHLGGNRSAVD